ncbi:unnamed protein product [Somion occarium]|uniref:Uncharacterized protein n=1 Tax=Somion occarium TaxID=3059160 RepID=A0ABP1EAY2_9APHY
MLTPDVEDRRESPKEGEVELGSVEMDEAKAFADNLIRASEQDMLERRVQREKNDPAVPESSNDTQLGVKMDTCADGYASPMTILPTLQKEDSQQSTSASPSAAAAPRPLLSILEEAKHLMAPIILQNARRRDSKADEGLIRRKVEALLTEEHCLEFVRLAKEAQAQMTTREVTPAPELLNGRTSVKRSRDSLTTTDESPMRPLKASRSMSPSSLTTTSPSKHSRRLCDDLPIAPQRRFDDLPASTPKMPRAMLKSLSPAKVPAQRDARTDDLHVPSLTGIHTPPKSAVKVMEIDSTSSNTDNSPPSDFPQEPRPAVEPPSIREESDLEAKLDTEPTELTPQISPDLHPPSQVLDVQELRDFTLPVVEAPQEGAVDDHASDEIETGKVLGDDQQRTPEIDARSPTDFTSSVNAPISMNVDRYQSNRERFNDTEAKPNEDHAVLTSREGSSGSAEDSVQDTQGEAPTHIQTDSVDQAILLERSQLSNDRQLSENAQKLNVDTRCSPSSEGQRESTEEHESELAIVPGTELNVSAVIENAVDSAQDMPVLRSTSGDDNSEDSGMPESNNAERKSGSPSPDAVNRRSEPLGPLAERSTLSEQQASESHVVSMDDSGRTHLKSPPRIPQAGEDSSSDLTKSSGSLISAQHAEILDHNMLLSTAPDISLPIVQTGRDTIAEPTHQSHDEPGVDAETDMQNRSVVQMHQPVGLLTDEARVSRTAGHISPSLESQAESQAMHIDTDRTSLTQPRSDFAPVLPPRCSVPGLWFVIPGKSSADILSFSFPVEDHVATAANRWANRHMSFDASSPHVKAQVSCLSLSKVTEMQHLLDPVTPLQDVLEGLWKIHAEWPQPGHLIIELNSESGDQRIWLPAEFGDGPLDVSAHIRPGLNTARFIQLSDMSDKLFILTASAPSAEETERCTTRSRDIALWNNFVERTMAQTLASGINVVARSIVLLNCTFCSKADPASDRIVSVSSWSNLMTLRIRYGGRRLYLSDRCLQLLRLLRQM